MDSPAKRHLAPPRITPVLPTSPTEQIVHSQFSNQSLANRNIQIPMEHAPNQTETQETLADRKNVSTDLTSVLRAEPQASAESAGTPATQSVQAKRALFCSPQSKTPVRRTKSEGYVHAPVASVDQTQSAIPQVCTDATMNDQLWSKLEPGNHRDSMSSSSSISSSDTVIDLSLPNLARKSLSSLPSASSTCEQPWGNCRHSAFVPCNTMRVNKSKSNPNLPQSECPIHELQSRPLQSPQEASLDSLNRLTQRRHTWSRLFMEELKQSSGRSRPSSTGTSVAATTCLSKSLGDLTSDDISCNFDSKYRSISRSFIIRPHRDQVHKGGLQKTKPPCNLTEQLRKLTDVEPLTASDFAAENKTKDPQEECVEETLVRRTSSRSQSRVRYIANRAKKAQERQRLQGLVQGRSASFSLTGSISRGSSSSPIEERGNPEGACCVARSPCNSLDLLSQLTPLGSPSLRQPQSSPGSENSEVFFMLKL